MATTRDRLAIDHGQWLSAWVGAHRPARVVLDLVGADTPPTG